MAYVTLNDDPFADLSTEDREAATSKLDAELARLLPRAVERCGKMRAITRSDLQDWHAELFADIPQIKPGTLREFPAQITLIGGTVDGKWTIADWPTLVGSRLIGAVDTLCQRVKPVPKGESAEPKHAAKAAGWFNGRIVRHAPFLAGNEILGHFGMSLVQILYGHDAVVVNPGDPALRRAMAATWRTRGGEPTAEYVVELLLERCAEAKKNPVDGASLLTPPLPEALSELQASDLEPPAEARHPPGAR